MSIGGNLQTFIFIAVSGVVINLSAACSFSSQQSQTEANQILLSEESESIEADEREMSTEVQHTETSPRVNLNTASREELMRLPGIGAGLAARIIEHRARFGRFRRPEHLMMVQGIGARRYATLKQFIEAK